MAEHEIRPALQEAARLLHVDAPTLECWLEQRDVHAMESAGMEAGINPRAMSGLIKLLIEDEARYLGAEERNSRQDRPDAF
ncbi:hypothetical protein Aph01nite_69940 [Acrocarpospora phusangensis]|uniref:Uncharacterized protein n=1 Tax=Acrocarpospora phusangensis TaxID=1070424 RepID=A0A919UPB1_9ACTN|nr:hypothetical protein [Acrocarpospora phusangensis]GIH28684.1 hypothetical protein Aph01nite_69940 [Acrocarpospora phusangensis]